MYCMRNATIVKVYLDWLNINKAYSYTTKIALGQLSRLKKYVHISVEITMFSTKLNSMDTSRRYYIRSSNYNLHVLRYVYKTIKYLWNTAGNICKIFKVYMMKFSKYLPPIISSNYMSVMLEKDLDSYNDKQAIL